MPALKRLEAVAHNPIVDGLPFQISGLEGGSLVWVGDPSRLLKKSPFFRNENGIITQMTVQIDCQSAVVVQFSFARAGYFVHFIASNPSEESGVSAEAAIHSSGYGSEGEFAAALR